MYNTELSIIFSLKKSAWARGWSARILIIVSSNMFALILLKKRAKYLSDFFKTSAKTCSNANFECRSGL